ncbi:response regulator transcription factor [Arabiibacter massiliensis]|uniref:response regulator transcription factor n=1 Tax=Arabiibacter massiliensis TaxID=1870985 RepID=UPI0009BC23C3|nr:helix-turn-helix transcriptional regulator [Arabiibacter massiliensis]
MGGKRKSSYTWTSFGFIVLVLVYQRVYSFYTTISMDYQVIIGFASAAAWIVLLALSRLGRERPGLYFICSLALLVAAFGTQEAYVVLFDQGVENDVLLLLSSALFSCGFALYCRLWLLVYQGKSLQSTLIYLSGSSALSAVVACLPPLVLGSSSAGGATAFAIRLAVVAASFWCLRKELHAGAAEEDALSESAAAPAREVWSAVKLVVIAAFAARFVQGLLVMNEVGYRDYGAYALLIASPLVSAAVIVLARRLGSRSGFISSLYWVLATCSIVVLLVVAAVSDSSISFLWVLLFAVYAQIDVAFMGILASVRSVFGSSFIGLTCVLFCAKDFVFALGRMMRDAVDVPTGCLICVIVLLAVTVFEFVVYLLQTLKNSHESDEPSSIPAALCASIAARYDLTPRESEVLYALLQGRSYTNIGHRLFISKSTVKTHANHIYAKMGVGTRDELIDLLEPRPAELGR